jgi:TATA-box binding protein (TBP) (component of TFIID and TFIIIB)
VKMMIFQTGEVILSGAKDLKEVESSFWNLKKKLKDLGARIDIRPDTEIEIQNVLATGNVKDYLPDLDIDLEKISSGVNATYDPEKFPAVFLSYPLHDCKATAMLFKSGKVLVGDVKSHEDANIVLEKVVEQVRY